ncbi:MAG: acyl carrier protein [Ruminococcaceae bacterium]|nr:acyl carrier protein [Oscillospiraceae bacterium]
MFEKIKTILVEEVGVDADLITPETKISSDLGVDSISFINAIMAIEENFDIEMDEDRLMALVTVTDLCNYVEELSK